MLYQACLNCSAYLLFLMQVLIHAILDWQVVLVSETSSPIRPFELKEPWVSRTKNYWGRSLSMLIGQGPDPRKGQSSFLSCHPLNGVIIDVCRALSERQYLYNGYVPTTCSGNGDRSVDWPHSGDRLKRRDTT